MKRLAALQIVLFLALAPSVEGQVLFGSIVGNVTDVTPQVRELYRVLFQGRDHELIAYEDDISTQEEAA